jgi:preprotein translocase subunit SecG
MAVIYGFLILVEIIVSALLICVIFLQKTKSGMGGTAFGGGMGEAIFGSRMGNVLTKATVVLGVIFLVNTVLLTMLTARRQSVGSVTDLAPVSQPAPSLPAPSSVPMPLPEPESVPVPADIPAPEAGDAAMAPVEIPAAPVVDIPAPVSVPAAPQETPAE